jgi:hypothetical protein
MWPNGFNIPGMCDTQVFYASQEPASSLVWQIWNKPSSISMVCINLIAAGGGGGLVTSTSIGAGGGGSGGMSCLIIPAVFLPNLIYIRVGAGGPGSAGSSLGVGGTTFISAEPTISASGLGIMTQAGGGAPAAGTLNTGGTAGSAGTTSSGIFIGQGIYYTIAGRPGGAGAASPNTSAATLTDFGSNGIPLTGGTGGGNGTGQGGAISEALPSWTARNGAIGTTGGAGGHGLRAGYKFDRLLGSNQPLVFSGGLGGGGGVSPSVGGIGGNGAYGCGGGGGGGGSGGGGAGGRGGDGVVIITSW